VEAEVTLLAASVYLQQAKNIPVTTFLGRWGSYKTLTAVATAHSLLRSGKFEKCYANFPVSFASTPPVLGDEFDFEAPYSHNTIFILDEAWSAFMSYDPARLKKIFAFPRKRNQSFLLTSVLPLANLKAYSHFFVEKFFNWQVFLVPLVTMEAYSAKDTKPSKFYIFYPGKWFRYYSSRYPAQSIYPIAQFRDSGVMYHNDTYQPIPPERAKYFVLNSWGLAEERPDLPPPVQYYIRRLYPRFNTLDQLRVKFPDPPKVKRKKELHLSSFVSTEFNISFMLKFLLIIYIILAGAKYTWFFNEANSGIFDCNETVKAVILMKSFSPSMCENVVEAKENEEKQQSIEPTQRPEQPTAVQPTATIEPTTTPTVRPTSTPYIPPYSH
jgi:hypothetical protein